MIFFPPNTTALIQPLDQGVIRTFKIYYTRDLFQIIFDKLENDQNKTLVEVWNQINILDCVETVASSIKKNKIFNIKRLLETPFTRNGNPYGSRGVRFIAFI